MDLIQEVATLNSEFDLVMRLAGHVWEFQDQNIMPKEKIDEYKTTIHSIEMNQSEKDGKLEEILQASDSLFDPLDPDISPLKPLSDIPAFEEYRHLGLLREFGFQIRTHLVRFSASQPPGVINSDIYPVVYRLQVSKWGPIALEHLRRVQGAIKRSFEAILESVCPRKGDTAILHHELKKRLNVMFDETFDKSRRDLETYCKQETEKQLLQTTDPAFGVELERWRYLRHLRAYQAKGDEHQDKNAAPIDTVDRIWVNTNLSSDERMAYDIHDIVKVYYGVRIQTGEKTSLDKHTNENCSFPLGRSSHMLPRIL